MGRISVFGKPASSIIGLGKFAIRESVLRGLIVIELLMPEALYLLTVSIFGSFVLFKKWMHFSMQIC